MKAAVILNDSAPSTGDGRSADLPERIRSRLTALGVEAAVDAVSAGRIAEAVRSAAASGADLVIVGGGDGTLSTAAGVLSGGAKPLAVLPLGTRNHFARDLGIPLDLDEALGVAARGLEARVDVGQLNGRVFLNNASLGLYPRLVREREEQEERFGHGRWVATLYAALAALRRFPLLTVVLRVDDRAVRVTTPFVFVGNNRYEMPLLRYHGRKRLDRGELCVYVSHNTGRAGLLRLALRALVARLDRDRDFTLVCLDEIEVESPRRSLRIAVDGEVVEMRPPLRFRTRPGALRVRVPGALP